MLSDAQDDPQCSWMSWISTDAQDDTQCSFMSWTVSLISKISLRIHKIVMKKDNFKASVAYHCKMFIKNISKSVSKSVSKKYLIIL